MICCVFCCSGKLVSPKWKNFKGLKLQWRDKIRLNNAIWRAWYMQCKYRARGGSLLRHRWDQENLNYCLVKSWGICSRSDGPEAALLDQGCMYPQWGCAECSKHSLRSPCFLLFMGKESWPGLLSHLATEVTALCRPCPCSALAFSLLFQTWRSARTPCATLWPLWTAPWTSMSTGGQRCVKPQEQPSQFCSL